MKKLERFKNSKLSLCSTVLFIFNKAFYSGLRGVLVALFYRKIAFPIFVGKSTRLLHKNNLETGRFVSFGDFGYFNFSSNAVVKIGDNVTIREFAWLQLTSDVSNPGEAIIIGPNTYIGPRCNLGAAAKLEIGPRCQIGAGVSFIAENHEFEPDIEIFEQGVSRIGITIGSDCWFGNNVTILDGVTIGEGSVIGANSLVNKSFPPYSIIVGSPARFVRSRDGANN